MSFTTTSGRLDVLVPDANAAPRPRRNLVEATVVDHRHVADRYWSLRLHAPQIAETAQPGQFVMLTVAQAHESAPVLPRPMAIYTTDAPSGSFEVMYGVVGAGTSRLTRIPVGSTITTVGPLGRGFSINPDTRHILLVGRGIGTCSLTSLAFAGAARGVAVTAVDSARNAHALIADETYRRAGVRRLLQVIDSDGTSARYAVQSALTTMVDSQPPQQIYTCGSQRLTQLCGALGQRWGAEVQVSLEAHMACGLGYCHGCATGTRTADNESPLICKDGPVFKLTRPATP